MNHMRRHEGQGEGRHPQARAPPSWLAGLVPVTSSGAGEENVTGALGPNSQVVSAGSPVLPPAVLSACGERGEEIGKGGREGGEEEGMKEPGQQCKCSPQAGKRGLGVPPACFPVSPLNEAATLPCRPPDPLVAPLRQVEGHL